MDAWKDQIGKGACEFKIANLLLASRRERSWRLIDYSLRGLVLVHLAVWLQMVSCSGGGGGSGWWFAVAHKNDNLGSQPISLS